MNILVTGGAGYIGSHTSLALIDKGHEVTIIDNLITGNAKAIPDKASFLNSDIADLQKINALLDDNKFDLIMHFAGLVRVEESFEEPNKYKINNIDKAKTFFDCCISRGLAPHRIRRARSGSARGNTSSRIWLVVGLCRRVRRSVGSHW